MSKTRMPTRIISVQHCTGVSSQYSKARKRKRIHVKRKNQNSVFRDGTVIYIENLMEYTAKLLKLISEYSKGSRIQNQYYNINFYIPQLMLRSVVAGIGCQEGKKRRTTGNFEGVMAMFIILIVVVKQVKIDQIVHFQYV